MQKGKVTIWKSLYQKSVVASAVLFIIRLFYIRADVYIHRAVHPTSGWIALICKLMGKKFIYMVAHDEEVKSGDQYGRRFSTLSIWMVFRFSSLVLCQNEFQKEKLEKKNITSKIFRNSFPVWGSNYSRKRKYILWVGRAESWKNPEMFLELAMEMKKEKFVMICPPAFTVTNLFSEIREKAKFLKNLIFIPYVSFEEIDSYFQEAKIFISTSESEGYPNTFLHAAIAGTPIVSYKVNPSGMFDKYEIGEFCNGDVSCLSSSVKKILQSAKVRGKYSKNIFSYAEENHNLEKSVKIFSEILENLKN